MTNKRSTKRALIASVVSLLLCFTMLMGTTYAWFTDSVESKNNVIKSGNLDVVLEWYDANETDEAKKWKPVDEDTNVFAEGVLWEPGHTQVVYLRVSNAGTLALRYNLGVNVASETEGTNVEGETFKLSNYIEFGVVEGKQPSYATREEARGAVKDSAKALSAGYCKSSTLAKKGDVEYAALVVYMPEDVGNEANYKTGTVAPQINLGLNLFASQLGSESDSFDANYDKDASVTTVAEANALMASGKDAYLIGADEPSSVLEIPAGYTGTLTLGNVKVKSIQAAENANIVILGNVTVDANGSSEAVVLAAADDEGVSAITANGTLTITGSGTLTAIANGKHAFGIGGNDTTAITIKGITINYVSGGYAYEVGTDKDYYKNAPEGGAAIGSGYDGAEITLDGVTVVKAIGGSKSAGIGARFWKGVDINITDSTIHYVEGGVSAAGIGGSRVSNGASESGVTITITNSDVTAQGGAFGAGIGSGYDTHTQSKQPLCTINISDSTINATGGRRAAGVGTGYHTAALAGEIKNSTVNAKSGEKVYKAGYTAAMDIGFGITNPSKEGQQTDSYLIYNGEKITLGEAPKSVSGATDLDTALNNGDNVVLSDDLTFSAGETEANSGYVQQVLLCQMAQFLTETVIP